MLNFGPMMVYFLAFAAVLAATPVMILYAKRLGLLDHPDERKQHSGSVPLVGGLAVYLGLLLVLGLGYSGDMRLFTLLGSGLLVLLAGLVDDRQGLSTARRFLVQATACVVMVFAAGVVLQDFGRLLWPGTLELGWLAIPVTIFCVMGVTNAMNMIDGMDGLSASVAMVCLLGLAAASVLSGQSLAFSPEIPALAGALTAYLLFNLRLPWRGRALAFLGDSGTLLLGFLLGWVLVEHSQGEGRSIDPVTALWLLAVPLMDTVFVMIKRGRAGKSIVAADREHLHHAFLRSGWSTNGALSLIVLWSCLLAAAGLSMQFSGVPERFSFLLFLLVGACYYLLMSRAWHRRRFLGRRLD